MGYICSNESSTVINKFGDYCVATTGKGNTYKVGDKEYFYQISRRDQPDNGICGEIYLCLPDDKCKKVGTFKINGQGEVVRGPKILKSFEKKPIVW